MRNEMERLQSKLSLTNKLRTHDLEFISPDLDGHVYYLSREMTTNVTQAQVIPCFMNIRV